MGMTPVTRHETYLDNIATNVQTIVDALSGGNIEVESLTVTENKTYTAPSGKAYSPVIVNVPTGGGDPEYYTATLDGSEPMMGLQYVLPSDADVTKIYAIAGNYTSGNGYSAIGFEQNGSSSKLHVSAYKDYTGSYMEMIWQAGTHSFEGFTDIDPTALPATIKLYHT